MTVSVALPKEGASRAKVKEMLAEVQQGDEDWMDGKVWNALYYAGDDIVEEGYLRLTKTCMDIRERMVTGIKGLGFEICGDPPGPLFAYTSSTMDMLAVAEAMNALGWRLNAANTPPVIPHWIRPINEPIVDEYLRDLAGVVNDNA
jgi:glutamate/tyrosine decarboxylase-like PLP-dependent enzyme